MLLIGFGCSPPVEPVSDAPRRPPDIHIYTLDLADLPSGTPADLASTEAGNDAGSVKCGGSSAVRLRELGTGQPDYLALENPGASAASIGGFRLVMHGIGPVSFSLPAGESLGAGKIIYLFEYASGRAGDLLTGDNIPFYDSSDANSVALWDASGRLLDYVAVGTKLVGLPSGASAQPVPWPTPFDPKTQSFQRVATGGSCPVFFASDWAVRPITRP